VPGFIPFNYSNKEVEFCMKQMRNAARTAVLLFVAVTFVSLTATAQGSGKAVLKVMSYNVNEGTDFLEVLSATNLDQFLKAVEVTLNNVDATNPPLRMQAVAKEIAQTQPDLVGLQEVTSWSVGGQVRYDMLEELLGALHQLGEDYVPVVVVDEFQLGGLLPDFVTSVQCLNHDVILARAASQLELSNIRKDHFNVILQLPTAVGPVDITRGWGSVDVSLHGASFRFIVSHLENYIAAAPATLLIQEAQAAELALGPAGTSLPAIVAVDTNADALGNDPTIATYQLITSFGFGDAWGAVHPDLAGPTWGFMPDAADPRPIRQRIDCIFFNNGIRALTAQLAGQRVQEKVNGLWPSDHAGVRAGLQVGSD
jgi:endonuclease/exonuclease/phosphatase family metal-dependent hydrolase